MLVVEQRMQRHLTSSESQHRCWIVWRCRLLQRCLLTHLMGLLTMVLSRASARALIRMLPR
jgi:hypothetical protein